MNSFFIRDNFCICSAAPKEKVVVVLHLIVLAEWDGAHVVFVAKLPRRRWQSTCTSPSLWIEMERTLYLWRSSREEGGSRPAPRRPCGLGWSACCICGEAPKEKVAVDLHLVVPADLGCVSYLGEYWTAAKPPSGRVALHSVGFFKLRRVPDCS